MDRSIIERFRSSDVFITSTYPDYMSRNNMLEYNKWLDVGENTRLISIISTSKRIQYFAAHILLRGSLAFLCNIKPAKLVFEKTCTGKPIIKHHEFKKAIDFSLSYRESFAVCAISTALKIGIDIEKIDSNINVSSLVNDVLSSYEKEYWNNEKSQNKLIRFFEFWTLKEAFLKAIGIGLRIRPSMIGFRLGKENFPILIHIPDYIGNKEDWTFRLYRPLKNHVCALAINTNPSKNLDINWKHLEVDELSKFHKMGS